MTTTIYDKIICRGCENYYKPSGNASDIAMQSMGYQQCSAAKTPIERGRWTKPTQICFYPDRFKIKVV